MNTIGNDLQRAYLDGYNDARKETAIELFYLINDYLRWDEEDLILFLQKYFLDKFGVEVEV